MISRNYKTEEIKSTPHKVDVRQMYNSESAQIMHMTLQPGESLIPHKTPVDVTFYVLEGKPTIHIGDEKESFGQDTLIESPATIMHCISNESEAIARILVTKAPRPSSPSKLL